MKATIYFLSLLGLGLQALYFGVSKSSVAYRQQSKLKRMNYEDTRKHWKELVDVLEAELNKYRQELRIQEFYILRGIITINFKGANFKNLAKLHKILCETQGSEVVAELRKFLKNNRYFY